MKLHELTIAQASGLLKNKEITSVELTRAILDRIDAVDGKVGAYLAVDAGRVWRSRSDFDFMWTGSSTWSL